jgi:parallel beta-helix repeat protein
VEERLINRKINLSGEMIRKAVCLAIVGLFAFGFFAGLTSAERVELVVQTVANALVPKYTSHPAIKISSNVEFNSTNGVTGGNGSTENPYIIEGLDINDTAKNPQIHILNTNVHFSVRNCQIRGNNTGNLTLGICYNKVWYGIIENCTISSNYYRGIYLYDSSMNKITNNTVAKNKIGIWMHTNSDSNNISYNQVNNNSEEGIVQGVVKRNSLWRNKIVSNGKYGLIIHVSSYIRTIDNFLCSNRGGIEIDSSSTKNMFCVNRFVDNKVKGKQAQDASGSNFWNMTGYGNYWSDWASPDNNTNGIVDFPYYLNGGKGSRDYFPIAWIPPSPPVPESPPPALALVLLIILPIVVAVRRRGEKC